MITPAVWRLIAIGGAIAALLGAVWAFGAHERHSQYLKDEPRIINPVSRKSWESEAKRDGAALRICHSNVSTLQASIDRQNTAVEALKAEGDRRAKMLSEALSGARKEALRATARADQIQSTKLAGGVCEQLLEVDRAVTGATP